MSTVTSRLRQANRAAFGRRWTSSEENDAFNQLASRYAERCLEARTDIDVEALNSWMDVDIEKSRLTHGRALDLGAGEGRSTERLIQRGFNAVGVERSPLVARRASSGRIIVGNAQAIPVRTGSEDLVVCNSLLEHVLDPEAVLQEVGRVLVPGGVCILHTTNRAHWRTGEIHFPLFQYLPNRARAWVWHMSGRTHISPHFFTYDGLSQLAARVGFAVSWPFDVTTPRVTGVKGIAIRCIFAFYRTNVGGMYIKLKSSVVELRLTRLES